MKEVATDVSFPQLEESMLRYWREHRIFERSMEPDAPRAPGGPREKRKSYIFYDGPPFATGLPHYGHLLAGTIKDVIGRFFAMKGYHVDRRFGWDCHGLPVEFEIQKTLDLHGAKAIREFGVGNFNEECRKIVLRYTKEWESFVERSGRWVDFSRQYRTMDLHFMESIWWVLKRLWDRGLIYESLKSVPYSWAINTPLSNFEANLNYKDVQDPAVTVRAPLRVDLPKRLGIRNAPPWGTTVYVWTTTPWTLPSNMAMAVGEEIEYALVANPEREEIAVVARALAPQIFPSLRTEDGGNHPTVLATCRGADLVGCEYEPFFPYFESKRGDKAFRIYGGDFVTADEGTGIVHLASFGEEDVELFLEHGIPVTDPVDEDGRFLPVVRDFAGLNVKEADPKIIADLRSRGLLVTHKTIEHSYPFCWRTDTPLIYKPIPTWFVSVETIRAELVQVNSVIHWVPEHIREGRMGKWLEGVRDWAISRNRFWGTPIPIWRCAACDEKICIGSLAELREKTGAAVDDLHSHFIDRLTARCGKCGGEMRRIPQVLDCWFESGSMPYAQAHYPFEGKEVFEANFPADFIAEGLDQTRGWFYTLLVLSTALFGRPAFRNVIVNGIVLAEDGKKMSKSLKNYPPPDEVMGEIGADAMRLSLLASAATKAEEIRFSKSSVRQVVRQTLLPLWNAYNFFVTYALVDEWNPAKVPSSPSPNLLDRWILSRVGSLIRGVDSALSNYHLYAAAQPMLDFVDQLTNWYIRLNRRRFWAGNDPQEREDKLHAYATLHKSLLAFVRVLAPLAPFVSEAIYLNLVDADEAKGDQSVHLTPFPDLSEFSGVEIDPQLEEAMELFEEVILLGRGLRSERNLKVRQPLSRLTIIHPAAEMLERLRLLQDYICEELNVKDVQYTTEEERFVTLRAQLNVKLLGKVLGSKLGSEGMKRLREKVEALSTREVRGVEEGGALEIDGIELRREDLLITRVTAPGADASASSGKISVVLDTALTPELRQEGLAREFVNRVQKTRKDLGFDVADRIVVHYLTACPNIAMALDDHRTYVTRETLAVEMIEVKSEGEMVSSLGRPVAHEIEGRTVVISLSRIQG